MAQLLAVPEVAAGATEVVLSEWLVAAGAAVKAGDPIAVVETDKAVVEIESEVDATILRLLAEPGTSVDVGSPMALLGAESDVGADLDGLLVALGARDADAQPTENEATTPEVHDSPVTAQVSPSPEGATDGSTERKFASPLARRMLRDAGFSVDDVTGTGPHGRVTRRDVEALIRSAAESERRAVADSPGHPAAAGDPVPAAAEPVNAPERRSRDEETGFVLEEHSRLRRAVAARLSQSKREVPHFYLRRSARLDALMALRQQVNEQSTTRISVNDFILKAVGVAHTAVPDANVVWTDDGMHRFAAVDVAVAIASDRGLVTPVLRSVETSSVSSLSAQVKSHVEDAKAGRLQQRDLEGGSISVTNLGMYGVDDFAAIINPPHAAILAVGAARPAPVVGEGEDGPSVEVATVVQLTLSVDHRAIDGALAAQWMDVLVNSLEHPLTLVI